MYDSIYYCLFYFCCIFNLFLFYCFYFIKEKINKISFLILTSLRYFILIIVTTFLVYLNNYLYYTIFNICYNLFASLFFFNYIYRFLSIRSKYYNNITILSTNRNLFFLVIILIIYIYCLIINIFYLILLNKNLIDQSLSTVNAFPYLNNVIIDCFNIYSFLVFKQKEMIIINNGFYGIIYSDELKQNIYKKYKNNDIFLYIQNNFQLFNQLPINDTIIKPLYLDNYTKTIVYKYQDSITLLEYLENMYNKLNITNLYLEINKILTTLNNIVNNLHNNNLIHGDLHLKNILINIKSLNLYLIDFDNYICYVKNDNYLYTNGLYYQNNNNNPYTIENEKNVLLTINKLLIEFNWKQLENISNTKYTSL
jgi:tRNA A-37 threonylcarbamoyl transferase component Bud32